MSIIIDDNSLIIIDDNNQSQLTVYDDTLIITHEKETALNIRALINILISLTGLSCDGDGGPKEDFIMAKGIGVFADKIVRSNEMLEYIQRKHVSTERANIIAEQDRLFQESLEKDKLKDREREKTLVPPLTPEVPPLTPEVPLTPAQRRALFLASYEQRRA